MDKVYHVLNTLEEQHAICVGGIIPTNFLKSEDYVALVSKHIKPVTAVWERHIRYS